MRHEFEDGIHETARDTRLAGCPPHDALSQGMRFHFLSRCLMQPSDWSSISWMSSVYLDTPPIVTSCHGTQRECQVILAAYSDHFLARALNPLSFDCWGAYWTAQWQESNDQRLIEMVHVDSSRACRILKDFNFHFVYPSLVGHSTICS